MGEHNWKTHFAITLKARERWGRWRKKKLLIGLSHCYSFCFLLGEFWFLDISPHELNVCQPFSQHTSFLPANLPSHSWLYVCFLWPTEISQGYLCDNGCGAIRWSLADSAVCTQLKTVVLLSQELPIANSSEWKGEAPWAPLFLDSWLIELTLSGSSRGNHSCCELMIAIVGSI